MQSSSSCREARSESRRQRKSKKTAAGCMSGIFHLLSRSSRKRLPSGKKVERAILTPGKLSPPPEKKRRTPDNLDNPKLPAPLSSAPLQVTLGQELHKLSCQTPRSPTLPAELRRPQTPSSPISPRPALVARLMGLDDIPVSTPDSAVEKRRKLLGALEQCTNDLHALKRIIEAVQVAEAKRKEVADGTREQRMLAVVVEVEDRKDVEQQPSPVSVLDALASPRDRRSSTRCGSPIISALPRFIEKPRCTFSSVWCKGTVENELRNRDAWSLSGNHSFYRRIMVDSLPRRSKCREKRFLENFSLPKASEGGRQERRWRSQAMVENVDEVWEDGVWEERFELGRIGLEMEEEILEELVEEMVVEMLAYLYKFSLYLKTNRCRKRLYF